jgi:hypothetical protein
VTALGNISAGSRLTSAMLQGVAPLVAYKTADQSTVSNATTWVSDSQLYVPLVANAIYVCEGVIVYEGGTQGSSDFDFQFTGSGMTMQATLTQIGRSGAVSLLNTSLSGAGNGTNGAGVKLSCSLMGSVSTTTAGTLQLQWRQHTSSTTTTYCHATSWLAFWQVQ